MWYVWYTDNNRFEVGLNVNGEFLFGGEASAGVSFQIGQIRYILCIYQ